MKLRTYTVGLLAVCAVICGIFASPHTAQAQGPQNNPTNADWQTYELGKGTFSVLLPGKPSEGFQASKDADIYIYTLSTKWGILVSNYSFLGEEAEKWPADRSESFYQGFWEGFSATLNEKFEQAKALERVKLEETRKVTFAAHDGLEFDFSIGQYRGRFLITRVGRHAFSAMILGPAEALSEYQERFLGSFKIKQPPPNQANQK